MSIKPINLENNPKEKNYEDYICAFFQSSGLYVERSIIYRETEEILELDIITTDFINKSPESSLIEIKSGKWSFGEIFKVKGWMVYLNFSNGIFIVKRKRDAIDYYQEKAEELGIKLIDNSDLGRTPNVLSKLIKGKINEDIVETLRFSYLMESTLLKQLKDLKKANPNSIAIKNLDDYHHIINSDSFFSNKPISRIKTLFNTYIKYKNITAKLGYEIENGNYSDDVENISKSNFASLFYKCEQSPLHISMLIEHNARITILKSCIEHLLKKHKNDFFKSSFSELIEYLLIPSTIRNGLALIVKENYFHCYPVFWQFFTYVMGGFILTDLESEEYKFISDNTGIPVDEIPNAFDAYNKLFPRNGGWFENLPHSNIKYLTFFPLPFCGIGANQRRYLHITDKKEEDQTFDELSIKLKGNKTMTDLYKWNNLGYNILKPILAR